MGAKFWIHHNFREIAQFLFTERQIDGNIFASMSREDIATIFPQPEKFVVGMKLYRVVQNVRTSSCQTDVNTCQLLNDLDALEDEAQSTKSTSSGCSAATRSTLSLFSKHSSDHSVQTPSRKRSISSGMATNLNKVPKFVVNIIRLRFIHLCNVAS